MARLKRDHSGYRSYGLYEKYRHPTISDGGGKRKSKKDTRKWCRGKIGVHHEWHSFQQKRWSDEKWDFIRTYTEIKCVVCRKDKYIKTAKARIYPYHIWINQPDREYESVQVRVNGKILPIAEFQYHADKYWCKQCYSWHKS